MNQQPSAYTAHAERRGPRAQTPSIVTDSPSTPPPSERADR